MHKSCVFILIFETCDVNKETVRDWVEQEITEITPRQEGTVHMPDMHCCSTYTLLQPHIRGAGNTTVYAYN